MAYYQKGTGYPVMLPENALFSNSPVRKYPLGMLAMDTFGNEYRYVQACEAIAFGELVTPVALATWDTSIVIDGAVTAGDTTVHVDGIVTARAANYYSGYYFRQGEAAGLGRLHRIASHAAMAAAGEVDLILDPTSPAQEAIADGTALQIYNPYHVELIDADLEAIRGVGVAPITATYFGFVQVGGVHPGVLCDGDNGAAVVAGEPITPYGTDPGQGQGVDASTPAEADFNEYLSPLLALDASTTDAGYVPALFIRRV